MKKKIYILTNFLISHKNNVLTFLKYFINNYLKGSINPAYCFVLGNLDFWAHNVAYWTSFL